MRHGIACTCVRSLWTRVLASESPGAVRFHPKQCVDSVWGQSDNLVTGARGNRSSIEMCGNRSDGWLAFHGVLIF